LPQTDIIQINTAYKIIPTSSMIDAVNVLRCLYGFIPQDTEGRFLDLE